MGALPAKQAQYVQYAEKDKTGRVIDEAFTKLGEDVGDVAESVDDLEKIKYDSINLGYGGDSGTLTDEQFQLIKNNPNAVVIRYGYVHRFINDNNPSGTAGILEYNTPVISISSGNITAVNIYTVKIDKTTKVWTAYSPNVSPRKMYLHKFEFTAGSTGVKACFDIVTNYSSSYGTNTLGNLLKRLGYESEPTSSNWGTAFRANANSDRVEIVGGKLVHYCYFSIYGKEQYGQNFTNMFWVERTFTLDISTGEFTSSDVTHSVTISGATDYKETVIEIPVNTQF